MLFRAAFKKTGVRFQSSYGYRQLCRFMFVILGGIFAGCVSLPDPGNAGVVHAEAVKQASFFDLKGRISVRVGQRLETGKIVWTRSEREERLEVFTPFGSQIAEIVKTASPGVVMRKGGESFTADSIGELTVDILGVALDLDLIAAWTQGIGLIDSQAQNIRLPNGDEWQVTAERFQRSGNHGFVARLSATRADTVVRLVIDEWQAR